MPVKARNGGYNRSPSHSRELGWWGIILISIFKSEYFGWTARSMWRVIRCSGQKQAIR